MPLGTSRLPGQKLQCMLDSGCNFTRTRKDCHRRVNLVKRKIYAIPKLKKGFNYLQIDKIQLCPTYYKILTQTYFYASYSKLYQKTQISMYFNPISEK